MLQLLICCCVRYEQTMLVAWNNVMDYIVILRPTSPRDSTSFYKGNGLCLKIKEPGFCSWSQDQRVKVFVLVRLRPEIKGLALGLNFLKRSRQQHWKRAVNSKNNNLLQMVTGKNCHSYVPLTHFTHKLLIHQFVSESPKWHGRTAPFRHLHNIWKKRQKRTLQCFQVLNTTLAS